MYALPYNKYLYPGFTTLYGGSSVLFPLTGKFYFRLKPIVTLCTHIGSGLLFGFSCFCSSNMNPKGHAQTGFLSVVDVVYVE